MINVKKRTKYDFQIKLKQFILHIFILFQKSLKVPKKYLKRVKSSNQGTKFLKVRALIRKVPALRRINYTSIEPVGISDTSLVSTPAEHSTPSSCYRW